MCLHQTIKSRLLRQERRMSHITVPAGIKVQPVAVRYAPDADAHHASLLILKMRLHQFHSRRQALDIRKVPA
jgi:hypothetical protein